MSTRKTINDEELNKEKAVSNTCNRSVLNNDWKHNRTSPEFVIKENSLFLSDFVTKNKNQCNNYYNQSHSSKINDVERFSPKIPNNSKGLKISDFFFGI